MAFDNIIPVGKGHFSREWECFVFYTAKRQIPLDAVLHRFRSRPLDFLSFQSIIVISTRLFFILPASVSLLATGSVAPFPCVNT